MQRKLVLIALALAALATTLTFGLVRGPGPGSATAASHREAPLISFTPAEDLTDVFMFRSYESGNQEKVVMIMNVNPTSEPSGAPTYYNFDPLATYGFNVDHDLDGSTDMRFEFNFNSEIRGPIRDLGLPFSYLGGVPNAIPPISALDGPGSEGLGLRQRYTVRMTTKPGRGLGRPTGLLSGTRDLFAVPSNVGPRTIPDYPGLAAKGIYDLGNGIRVFAGQRQDPFWIDLGGVFDTFNLGRTPPLLTAAEDADDTRNAFGVDMLSGFNVSTIAIEMPASLLTADAGTTTGTTQPVLGMWANVSKFVTSVSGAGSGRGVGGFTQTNRMANPLLNELVIGTVDKDRWNAVTPAEDLQFAMYALNPRLATAFELLGLPATGCVPLLVAPGQNCTKTNRVDLINALLTYSPTATPTGDLLRLNLRTIPLALANQKRLGILATTAVGTPAVFVATPDPAAWPNGRRPKDDVVDLAIRVVGGPNYIAGRAGDGINVDDFQLPTTFPFLSTPSDGRNRVHLDRRDPVFTGPALGGP